MCAIITYSICVAIAAPQNLLQPCPHVVVWPQINWPARLSSCSRPFLSAHTTVYCKATGRFPHVLQGDCRLELVHLGSGHHA